MRDRLGNQGAPGGLEAGRVHRRDGLGVVDAGVPENEAHPDSRIRGDDSPRGRPWNRASGRHTSMRPSAPTCAVTRPWNRCTGSVTPAGVRPETGPDVRPHAAVDVARHVDGDRQPEPRRLEEDAHPGALPEPRVPERPARVVRGGGAADPACQFN